MRQFLESANLLQTITLEAEKNSAEAKALLEGLSEAQLSWTPAPGSWSIGQCLDHLTTTSKAFEAYLTAAIKRGSEKWPVRSPIPYRPSWVGGWLIKQVLPETTRKVPSPKVFQPLHTPAIEKVLEKFLKQQDDFICFVRQAEGVDYNKTRLRSPVTPLMRYSLADAFVVTVVHGWRHLAQARRVCETPGFPAN
ncbi:MAG TPA: DinB family protein [Pyrinomonadaceae bacterium]|nr:DinB family protein [Pyrinomonadaceae bacterium]